MTDDRQELPLTVRTGIQAGGANPIEDAYFALLDALHGPTDLLYDLLYPDQPAANAGKERTK